MPQTNLSVGWVGGSVAWVQHFLINNGVGPAAAALKNVGATEYFGPLTKAALAEYQKAHSISPAAGYFGPLTRAAIEKNMTSKDAVFFKGKIEAVNTGCFADGLCTVTVDGKKVIVTAGYRMNVPPLGSMKGVESIGDFENKIGEEAVVYAVVSDDEGADYTLYGSTTYYIEVK